VGFGTGFGAGVGVGLGVGLGVGFVVVGLAFGVAFGVVRAVGDGDDVVVDGRGTAATVRVSAAGLVPIDEVGSGLVCTDVGVTVGVTMGVTDVGVDGAVGGRSASRGGFTGGVASSRPHPGDEPGGGQHGDRGGRIRQDAPSDHERAEHGHLPSDDTAVPGGDRSPKCPVSECGPLSSIAHPAAPPHPAPTGHRARRCRAADVGWTTR
jgi:hypothetical protein